MIVLSATTDAIEAVLGGTVTTNQMQCVSVWRDVTTTDYTPGRTVINTNNTSAVDVVTGPAGSTQRVIDLINIYNNDTVPQRLTISFDANGTEYILWKGSLASGESVQYVDGTGWTKFSSGGVMQIASGGPVNIQSQLTAGAGTWTKPTTFTPTVVRVIA